MRTTFDNALGLGIRRGDRNILVCRMSRISRSPMDGYFGQCGRNLSELAQVLACDPPFSRTCRSVRRPILSTTSMRRYSAAGRGEQWRYLPTLTSRRLGRYLSRHRNNVR